MIASGLPQRCLRSRRRHDRGLVGRVAREVEAAESLDREDRPVAQQRRGGREDRVASARASASRSRCGRGHGALESGDQVQSRFAIAELARAQRERSLLRGVPGLQVQPRPAHEARVGLRVEAAVGGVAVLGRALRAHREVAHRGHRPVVGDVLDDREARSAVGAVDERVARSAGRRRRRAPRGTPGTSRCRARRASSRPPPRATRGSRSREALGLDLLGDDLTR